MFGFPTEAKAVRDVELVDCTVINSGSVGTLAFSLSVRPTTRQTSGKKEAKEPLGSLMASSLDSTVDGAFARDL